MEPKVKTTGVAYVVKINNDETDSRPSLKEARQLVKTMPINDDLVKVSIVKRTTTEQVLDVYEPQVTKVLTASDFSLDIE